MTTRETNVNRFCESYSDCLLQALADRPEDYAYRPDDIPDVADRMRAAFIRGSYNHNGYAMRLACKAVGIKHTRKAMEAFFNAE